MSTPCGSTIKINGQPTACERIAGHSGKHHTTFCGRLVQWSHSRPSPTTKAAECIRNAMEILEAAGCGGAGADGMALDEMLAAWNRGDVPGNDAYYATGQHAWLVLRGALDVLTQMERFSEKGRTP